MCNLLCLYVITEGTSCHVVFCFCVSVVIFLILSVVFLIKYNCQTENIKIFPIKREDEQVLFTAISWVRGIGRWLRHSKHDHVYLTFLQNSNKNDIMYCHWSCLFLLFLYHYFLSQVPCYPNHCWHENTCYSHFLVVRSGTEWIIPVTHHSSLRTML